MDSPQEKEETEEDATWTKVSEYFQEIVDRLEQQQNDRLEKLREALEDVE